MKTPLYLHGMHGMGDCIHQRALLRQLMPEHEIWLETSWPAIYHDMPELHLVARGTKLRTQLKNAAREADKFESAVPEIAQHMQITYRPEDVRRYGSVLAAMMRSANTNFAEADFSLPIPDAWHAKAQAWIDKWQPTKPILFFRPLIERKEWSGCPSRNPEHAAYDVLLHTIRDDYFMVSVADLCPVEWLASAPIKADATCHAGELDFETMAALMQRSALAWSSPGFATVLALAVGTPVVTVFGGYENSKSFFGRKYLGIDPIESCQCFSHHHKCKKTIDIPQAQKQIKRFINEFADHKAAA